MRLISLRAHAARAAFVGLTFAAGLASVDRATSQVPSRDRNLIERLDAYLETERRASGIPGLALAAVQDGQVAHVRGFGHDGRGNAVTGDTLFPIGSLTKSFTALLVRQMIDAGLIDADAPVQRYLPWFRVADADASPRITVRHLLTQTSGFSRSDGLQPLLQGSRANTRELARSLAAVSLNRPVGSSFEYSNLNFVILGAILEELSGRSYADLVRAQVFDPLGMNRSRTTFAGADATQLHRIWFGYPVAYDQPAAPGFIATGNLTSSAHDMARYIAMILGRGATPGGRVVSADGVERMLAPSSPPGRSRLMSMDFQFRYGEGWFVGPFGSATDARWHLGSLPSFTAWMVLLPETRQAVVLLINANCEQPFRAVNATFSRMAVGVVDLLRGRAAPTGPSIPQAYRWFNLGAAGLIALLSAFAWWASRTLLNWPAWLSLAGAAALLATPKLMGFSWSALWQFAPDLSLVIAAMTVLLTCPLPLRRLSRRP